MGLQSSSSSYVINVLGKPVQLFTPVSYIKVVDLHERLTCIPNINMYVHCLACNVSDVSTAKRVSKVLSFFHCSFISLCIYLWVYIYICAHVIIGDYK